MEVEGEIRLQVDELMRQELKNLKLVSKTAIILILTLSGHCICRLNCDWQVVESGEN